MDSRCFSKDILEPAQNLCDNLQLLKISHNQLYNKISTRGNALELKKQAQVIKRALKRKSNFIVVDELSEDLAICAWQFKCDLNLMQSVDINFYHKFSQYVSPFVIKFNERIEELLTEVEPERLDIDIEI